MTQPGADFLGVQALVEHLPIEEARPHHGGEDADDHDHQDQLDEGEAAGMHGVSSRRSAC
ncbi:hypothetical protein D3C78_1408690 [compost metagenome]